MPIGQVGIRFYLPHLMFYLPRAGGQCLMSSPGLFNAIVFNDVNTCKAYNTPYEGPSVANEGSRKLVVFDRKLGGK